MSLSQRQTAKFPWFEWRALLRPNAWPLLLLVVGLPVLLVGWTAAGASRTGAVPAEGGTLTEGVVGPAPQTINPLFADSAGERDLVSLIFSGLTRPGPDGNPQPDLAESWVVSSDATSFTFVLRRNVRWQDGQPFTAQDVLFTQQAFSAPGVKGDPSTAEVWRRARVQIRNPYTVTFQFDSSFAPFLAYSSAGILPSHILAGDTPGQLVNDPFNRHPIGTGPFKLVSLSSSGAGLQRNDAYYLAVPYLHGVSLRFMPDGNTLLRELEQKRVDSGLLPPPLEPADLDRLRASGKTLIGGLRSAYSLVYLNLNAAQFQDPVVRRAMSMATDRNRLTQAIMDGQATPADAPLPPGTWAGADTNGAPNVSGAKALLQQDGWKPGPDGVLQQNGISLSFALQTTDDAQRTALANELATEWRAIGVGARVQTMRESDLLQNVLLPHKYEAVLYGWDPGPDPDPFPAWHSSQRGEQGRNLSNYANPRADQLLEAARLTADPNQRAAIYSAFIDLFRQDMPAVILFFPRYVYAVPQKLSGVQLSLLSSTSDRFADVEEWSLASRQR
ncbi:MAG TPA: peptide ABC transporter substrate-binding protein [Dehalococcoidia bacterium]